MILKRTYVLLPNFIACKYGFTLFGEEEDIILQWNYFILASPKHILLWQKKVRDIIIWQKKVSTCLIFLSMVVTFFC